MYDLLKQEDGVGRTGEMSGGTEEGIMIKEYLLCPGHGVPQKATMVCKLICKSKELLFKLKLGPSMCPTKGYDQRVLRPDKVGFFIIVRGWGAGISKGSRP